MISKEPSSESYRRSRQQRCSSLFVSTPSQIEYVKSLRRLSFGEKGGTIKVVNRNSKEYMDGVPDNFRLSEMFAKEIKITDKEEQLLENKEIFCDNSIAQ